MDHPTPEPASKQEYRITPTMLVYGGEALARLPDGRAAFFPFALPGEQVRIRVIEEKRGHVRAELIEILKPSPERIPPRCPHFTECGGCHYQHIPYERQIQYKTEILRDQLARIGKISRPPFRPAVESPQRFNYRNHVQFHLNLQGKLGFLSSRSNQVVPVSECHLPEAALNEVWPLLDIEPVAGLERVSLRHGNEEDIQIIFESKNPEPFEFSVEELMISAVHLGPDGAIVLAGSPTVNIQVLDRNFQVSAGAFFQVNTIQATAMVEHLLDCLPLTPQTTLLDVYSGVGLFSAFLAPRVEKLVGIELNHAACEDFAVNLNEFDNVELYQAPAEQVLKHRKFDVQGILVDPPRAGLGRRTIEGILAQEASWLAYVSCDPATLARDARQLIEAGYHLEHITPFDLFPQTYHIESISYWKK
jgi:23S rRNA (uracil1939-C5)-methyltransferase